MSRTGNKPIVLPDKVKARVEQTKIFIEGPLGKLDVDVLAPLSVEVKDKAIQLSRPDNSREAKRLHGLCRALVQNAVKGVAEGFSKTLLIEGVGYRAELKGAQLNLSLGFSHPINFEIPQGIKAMVDKQTKIVVSGIDRGLVGQVTANIRDFRPPEPYKGKGIRYENEHIQRKVGKAAASGK